MFASTERKILNLYKKKFHNFFIFCCCDVGSFLDVYSNNSDTEETLVVHPDRQNLNEKFLADANAHSSS